MFIAFGMLFFIPLVLIVFNLIGQSSLKFKQVYDKITGADKPPTTQFAPHWFMMGAIVIFFACLLSFIINFMVKIFKK